MVNMIFLYMKGEKVLLTVLVNYEIDSELIEID